LRLDDYDFILPEHLIAQAPIRPRDAARMLVVRPDGVEDRGVRDLPALLGPGDVMVVNDTRVIPARLHARRGQARVEIMLNRHEEAGIWHALIRNARRLKAGDEIVIEGAEDCTARVLAAPRGLISARTRRGSRLLWKRPVRFPCRPISAAPKAQPLKIFVIIKRFSRVALALSLPPPQAFISPRRCCKRLMRAV
jgi:hypothetical protein